MSDVEKAHLRLGNIIDALKEVNYQGAIVDVPEGSRYATFSETCLKTLITKLSSVQGLLK